MLAVAIHVLTAPRYGYFRDEFYILACGRHPAWGYVDHAPLVGWIAAAVSATLGTSLYALRFVTGLSAAGKLLLTAALAREFGGQRPAQLLAAGATLLVPAFLIHDNQFSLNTWEPLFWVGTVAIILASLRLHRPKLLLGAGLLVGLGLENKHSTIFFLACLAVGLVLKPARRLFRERYFYLALLLAFVVFLPNFIWQYTHNWATLEFLKNVDSSHKNVELPPLQFLMQQALMLGPVNSVMWIPGLYLLLRQKRFRFLGIAYLAMLALMMALHGKDYYLAPVYPLLFAAGAVFWSIRGRALWVFVLMIPEALLLAPLTLPLLPSDRIVPYVSKLGLAPSRTETAQTGPLLQFVGDQFGWPELAAAVAVTFRALPESERAVTAIYTGNYGDAGALELYGPAAHLPRVLSAHNTYWYWGQGATASTLILVNSERLIRENRCASVTDGPEVGHPLAMGEEHFRIHVCHGLKQPLPELWPTLKHWQ